MHLRLEIMMQSGTYLVLVLVNGKVPEHERFPREVEQSDELPSVKRGNVREAGCRFRSMLVIKGIDDGRFCWGVWANTAEQGGHSGDFGKIYLN